MSTEVDYKYGAYLLTDQRRKFIDSKGKWADPGGGGFTNAKVVHFNEGLLEGSSDEYIDVTGWGASIGGEAAISVSAWVNLDFMPSAQCAVFSSTNQGTNEKFAGEITNAGELFIRVQTANGQTEIGRGSSGSAGPVTAGSWYHCVWMADVAAEDLDLYINGVKLSNSDVAIGLESWSAEEVNTRIGQNWDGTKPVRGKLDEITIFNKFLSGAEVTELYNSGTPADPTTHSAAANLINYWKMGDGATFPTIPDEVGSINGTMTNMESGDIKDL